VPKDPPEGIRTEHGRDGWRALVANPGSALVALDYDGTLAPIVPRPEDARAQPGAVEVLAALAGHGVQVTVITGRPVEAALRLGGLDAVPGLVILGHYGLQRWQDGRVTSPEPGPGVDAARDRLTAYAAQAGSGVTVEDKTHSVALHTRNADDPTAAFESARPMAADLATETDLELVPGRFVLELRPPGTDKGGALQEAIEESAAAAVLFAGDDLGDLPALDAIDELRRQQGRALVLCSDSLETPAMLRDRADLVVDGPPGVVAALGALSAAMTAG
jgi:trehalose 6-phosphate phosphatase